MKQTSNKCIIFAFLTLIMTIITIISSTMAWFTASRKVNATMNGFEVTLPPSQKADLYYLNKNYNSNLNLYSGYEKEKLTNEEKRAFTKISDSDNKTEQLSPTSTSSLWPNSQLTFALVFTPLVPEILFSVSLPGNQRQAMTKGLKKIKVSGFLGPSESMPIVLNTKKASKKHWIISIIGRKTNLNLLTQIQ